MGKVSQYIQLKNFNPEIHQDMIEYLKGHSIRETAEYIAPKLNENAASFYHKLADWSVKYGLKRPPQHNEVVEKFIEPVAIANAPQPLKKGEEKELTAEETMMIHKFKNGEIGFEEAQRELASRVFEKILKNPELVRVTDWLKSEVVLLQREKLAVEKEQMKMNWVKLMGAFMPPDTCPKCGENLQPKASVPIQVVDGEEGYEESVGTSTNIQ